MRKKPPGVLARLTLAVLLLGMLLPGGAVMAAETENGVTAASQFTDVEIDNSNLAYINYVTAKGIMSGFPDGSFQPGEGLTRAQAAVIISKAANLNLSSQEASGFKDLARDHWAANYISAAVKAGYLKGLGDGSYQPEEPLTRAQGVSLILRLSKQTDPGTALPELADMDPTHWAARSMAIALDSGMIDAPVNNSIQPDRPMNRGDISRALAVLLTSDPDLSSRKLYSTMTVKKGTVKLAHGSGEAQLITNSAPIGEGDTVVTGKDGEAVINYPDGSSLLLKRNSTLTIKASQGRAYIKQDGQPGTAVDDLQVELKVGVMFGGLSSLATPAAAEPSPTSMKKTSGRLAAATSRYDLLAAGGETPWYKTAEKKKVKVKVDMPWGVAAIRGSFWSNTVNSDGSGNTNLLEGSASVSSGGQSVDLSPGQGTESSGAGAPPSPPAPMSPQQQSEWNQQQSWVQSTFTNMSQNQGAPMGGTPAGTGTPSASGNPAAALSQTLNQALGQAQQAASGIPSSSSGGSSSSSGGTITVSDMPATIRVSYVINPNNGEIQGSASRCFSVNRADAAITWTPATPAKVEIAVSGSGTSRCISLTALERGTETITFTVTAPGCTPLTKTITVDVLPLFKTTPNYKMAGYSAPVSVQIYNSGTALWSSESSGLAVQIIDSYSGQPVGVGGSAAPISPTPESAYKAWLELPAGLGIGQYEMLVYNGGNLVGMGMFRVGITPATLLPPVFGASVDEPFRMPLIDVDPDWLSLVSAGGSSTKVMMGEDELDSGWDIDEEAGQAFLEIDPSEIEALNTKPGTHTFSIEHTSWEGGASSPAFFVSAGRPAEGGYYWASFGAPVLTMSLLDQYGNPAGPDIIYGTVTVINEGEAFDETYKINDIKLVDGETLQLLYNANANATSTSFAVQVPAAVLIDSGDGFSVLFWIDRDGYPGYSLGVDFAINPTADGVLFAYPGLP